MVRDDDRRHWNLPPLSWDDNLDRITERIGQLAQAQRRMHALLDAVLAVSRELELPSVLRRIVSTAMELVDARYGALGVLTLTGRLWRSSSPSASVRRNART